MKTSLIKCTMITVIACGIVFPVMTYGADRQTKATTASGSAARFSSDRPKVEYLFRHTHEMPYDIKCLSWYGGVMERILVQNKSDQPIAINFEIKNLTNGVIASATGRRRVSKICEPGKRIVLMDMLGKDGNSKLTYKFSHNWQSAGQFAMTQHLDRLSSIPESLPLRYTSFNLGSVF